MIDIFFFAVCVCVCDFIVFSLVLYCNGEEDISEWEINKEVEERERNKKVKIKNSWGNERKDWRKEQWETEKEEEKIMNQRGKKWKGELEEEKKMK